MDFWYLQPKGSSMKNLRVISQWLFFLIFIFLFVQTTYRGVDEISYPVRIFLFFDPLIAISTIISSHRIAFYMIFSAITLLFTLFMGRFFCGWVCPFGTLNQWIANLKKSSSLFLSKRQNQLISLKYYLLIFFLASSFFSLPLIGLFDPLSLLIRSFTIVIEPIVSFIFSLIFEILNLLGFRYAFEINQFLKETILPFREPHYIHFLLVGFLFFIILSLNFIEKRFWCKYLCPLGALLGIFARFSIFIRYTGDRCNLCGDCSNVCPSNALILPEKWLKSECFFCGQCQNICPKRDIHFGFVKTKKAFYPSLSRRRFISSALGGFFFSFFIRIDPVKKKKDPFLIRPPGAISEDEFLKRCIKCGECMKVCLTGGLQPLFLEAGIDGIFSPVLVPKIGYCQYYCTLCGQVCPTGAIKKLTIKEKQKIKIGIATIDTTRCIPYLYGVDCIVCEEHCPTEKKAIWFKEEEKVMKNGKKKKVKLPKVDPELCIGCGICEYKCPLLDKPAIIVTNLGETREEENYIPIPSI